jgi:hypothetical protein
MDSMSDFLCDKRSDLSEFLNPSEKVHICGENDRNPRFEYSIKQQQCMKSEMHVSSELTLDRSSTGKQTFSHVYRDFSVIGNGAFRALEKFPLFVRFIR